MFELYFADLIPVAQKAFLDAFGLQDASEGNYDVLPIMTLYAPENDEEHDDEE